MQPKTESKKLGALIESELKLGSFKAYLYDCDGTLADSMGPHKEAWRDIIQKHAPSVTTEVIFNLIDELAGMPGFKTIEVLNERFNLSLDAKALSHEKEKHFFDHYRYRVTPIQFVVDHLKLRASEGAKIAVVSGGRKAVVRSIIEKIGIDDLVLYDVCAEDVRFGKPHPEPYLMAAEFFGIEPKDCLVLEDAEMGVRSAISAGMKWVRVDQV